MLEVLYIATELPVAFASPLPMGPPGLTGTPLPHKAAMLLNPPIPMLPLASTKSSHPSFPKFTPTVPAPLSGAPFPESAPHSNAPTARTPPETPELAPPALLPTIPAAPPLEPPAALPPTVPLKLKLLQASGVTRTRPPRSRAESAGACRALSSLRSGSRFSSLRGYPGRLLSADFFLSGGVQSRCLRRDPAKLAEGLGEGLSI